MEAQDGDLLREDPILAEMVRRLVDSFRPQSIYLFGSRARGSADPGSDYDLLMVVSVSMLPRYQRERDAFRALCGVGAPKDILVLTLSEFDEKRKVLCSLPATVHREGKLIYAA